MPLEIAVDSEHAASMAARHAHRIELCERLDLDGLTPSPALVSRVRQAINGASPRPSLVVLVRPVVSSQLTDEELALAIRQVEQAIGAGADAVAFGVLDARSHIDSSACERLVRACSGCAAVFHRAFDFVPDRGEALEELVDLGFARILTAGEPSFAVTRSLPERLAAIRDSVRIAAGRIGVVGCAGVRSENVLRFLEATPDVHSSCRRPGAGGEPAFDPEEAALLSRLVQSPR